MQLIINADETTGAVSVTGPLQNTVVCLGLLEIAKDEIKAWALEQKQKQVRMPNLLEIGAIKGGRQ